MKVVINVHMYDIEKGIDKTYFKTYNEKFDGDLHGFIKDIGIKFADDMSDTIKQWEGYDLGNNGEQLAQDFFDLLSRLETSMNAEWCIRAKYEGRIAKYVKGREKKEIISKILQSEYDILEVWEGAFDWEGINYILEEHECADGIAIKYRVRNG